MFSLANSPCTAAVPEQQHAVFLSTKGALSSNHTVVDASQHAASLHMVLEPNERKVYAVRRFTMQWHD